jgi:hypothetical protein
VTHRTLIPLNICLAAIICFLAVKVYAVWNTPYTMPPIPAKELGPKPDTLKSRARTEVSRVKDTYDVIVQKNLFSEDRGYDEGTESLIQPSEMVLHGTFIFGVYKAALLEVQAKEEKKGKSGNKKAKKVTVGDTIGGYRVNDILQDKVILENNAGKCCMVKLEIPKERSHARTSVSQAAQKRGVPRKRIPPKRPSRTTRK